MTSCRSPRRICQTWANVRVVILNGQKTVDGVKDSKFANGRIALQYGPGVVKDKAW